MAHAELNQINEACHCIDEAMTAIETNKEKWFEAEALRIAGDIALMSPTRDMAKAETYFERALSVARDQQAKSFELRAAMSMARLWRSQRKQKKARDLLIRSTAHLVKVSTRSICGRPMLCLEICDRMGALDSLRS